MKLYDVARDVQETLNDGIGCVLLYKMGKNWGYLETWDIDYDTNTIEEDAIDLDEIRTILSTSYRAILVNGYDSAFLQGSIKHIEKGLRYAFEEFEPLTLSTLIIEVTAEPVKTEPTEEELKANLISDLLSDNDNYTNADGKCECFKCELKGMCVYHDNYQRLPHALGLCYKLKMSEFSLYDFIERHLNEYKIIVETRKNKREFVEKDLCQVLSNIAEVSSIEYIVQYHEEYAYITFNNGSPRRICITACSHLAILKDVATKLLE